MNVCIKVLKNTFSTLKSSLDLKKHTCRRDGMNINVQVIPLGKNCAIKHFSYLLKVPLKRKMMLPQWIDLAK